MFQPFSVCEDYINPIYLKQELSKCILKAMRFIHELSDDKLKDKEVGCVSDLLKAIKTLLVRCSLRELVTTVDNLRLDITIRMLNIPHFNAKMNALKEVVRLTEEPFQVSSVLPNRLSTLQHGTIVISYTCSSIDLCHIYALV